MLQLTGIEKSFGSHPVFAIDSLHLPGGIYWLKGMNGSGKSTLMKILAGMLPFKGEITLDEIDLRRQPTAYRYRINHAPAEPLYPSFLTGNELLDFVSSIKQGTPQQAAEVKRALGIDQFLQNPTGSYSSGMLKKLSLLLAFMGKPVWILLDEPFTTLDQASQNALCQLIVEKHAQGTSFLLTSHHDIETSQLHFTRVFTLVDKKLIETT